MSNRSSIFDLIGPVMIGPSSSHTAGVMRIALVGNYLLGGHPSTAYITFYNSFAKTYQGHGSDRAVIGGLLGYATDDRRVVGALDAAQQQVPPLDYTFHAIGNASQYHPNTIMLELVRGEERLTLLGVSVGGGKVLITEIDGFAVQFSGSANTLVVYGGDQTGLIAAMVAILGSYGIGGMVFTRKEKGGEAFGVLECDRSIDAAAMAKIRQVAGVSKLHYVPKLY